MPDIETLKASPEEIANREASVAKVVDPETKISKIIEVDGDQKKRVRAIYRVYNTVEPTEEQFQAFVQELFSEAVSNRWNMARQIISDRRAAQADADPDSV